jgi:hypothetical protein
MAIRGHVLCSFLRGIEFGSTAEWGKFAIDSPLEERRFELSVPP